eukprot:SAG22_NODE_10573_length_527_cov_0.843458_1_plen_44_part_10
MATLPRLWLLLLSSPCSSAQLQPPQPQPALTDAVTFGDAASEAA